jgi:hypothetical protein
VESPKALDVTRRGFPGSFVSFGDLKGFHSSIDGSRKENVVVQINLRPRWLVWIHRGNLSIINGLYAKQRSFSKVSQHFVHDSGREKVGVST